jgi:GrpB-like predicted nucleotidyltransferase (UPF0157 family)
MIEVRQGWDGRAAVDWWLRDHLQVAAVRIRSSDDVRPVAEAAFDEHRGGCACAGAWRGGEHVGATAVPGALTKGDVDLLVRVSEPDFRRAVEVLRRQYVVHQPHNWTPTLASFKARDVSELEVGIQLVVDGLDADGFFRPFRDALISTPGLLAEYNRLKLRLDGLDYERYTEQKGEFIERVLRDLNGQPP